jgi:predicted PurR-regulated permease PerM
MPMSRTEDDLAAVSAPDEEAREPHSPAAVAAPPADAEPEPAIAELEAPPEPPPAVAKVIVPRWIQIVVLPLTVLAIWELMRAAKHVLLLLIIAAIIALILNPLVAFVQRARVPRGLAVLTVFLVFFLTVAAIGYLLFNPVTNQIRSFTNDVPHLVNQANKRLADLQHYLNKQGIHVTIVKQGKTALQTLQEKVVKGSSSLVSFGESAATKIASVAFDLILIFVLTVYLLLHGERIGTLVRHVMPPGDGTPADDYPTRVQRAVSMYVRGQLLFSLIMGTTVGVCLYVFGVLGIFPAGETYAVAFGAFVAVMELIPYVGPVLGAIPPVLVALFSDPLSAVWVALLFLVLQQFEGHVIAPQIFGHTLRINPIIVILSLLVGSAIYGLVGAIIALPVAAVARETGLYLHRHLELEPWGGSRDPLP